MTFQVKILPDEISCIDKEKNIYSVSKVKVLSDTRSEPDRLYSKRTRFYKLICAKGTVHTAEVERPGVVVIH